MPGKNIYENIRTAGGISFEYADIIESDFAAASGAAYAPPEDGTFRRINVARAIQLVSDCPVVVETFQTSAGEVRLPANTASETTDDAGDGRLFWIKNSGVGNITVKDYLGVTLYTLKVGVNILVLGNTTNNWDILDASNLPFDNSTNGFVAYKTQSAIEEIDFRQETLEPTGFMNTYNDSTVSFSESTRIFSISPVSGSFKYFIRGIEYVKTATETTTIGNLDGLWFIFYSGTTLTASQTPWTFTDPVAFVQVVYWNVTTQKATLINEERHGLVTEWATHRYLHLTIGTTRERNKFAMTNFILRGDGTLDAHATIGIGNLGRIFDEDLDVLPVNSATPTLPYQQILENIAYIPLLYRLGANGIWAKLTATQFPVAWTAGQLLKYNQWTGATWQLTTMTNNYFICIYVCGTLDSRHPFIGFIDSSQHQSVAEAAADTWDGFVAAGTLPISELLPLYKLIYQTSTTYTNQPKAVLYAILDVNDTQIDNDRYTVEVNANGNFGVGKYFDRVGGSSSLDNPFIFPESSFVRFMTLQSQRGTTPTCTVGVFKITDLVNPVITISLAGQNSNTVSYSQYFNTGDQITWRVTAGSINKGYITTWIQAQLG